MLPGNARARVPRSGGIESVFLNIPYDDAFENLYLAYIVGLTQLGLRINATLAIPNQGRLTTIINNKVTDSTYPIGIAFVIARYDCA